ncbi:MAG TPA: response regulator [Candidatus Nitrosotalea sp.]|nr:response regulator [Candidatus Nitrosotalea sp.]
MLIEDSPAISLLIAEFLKKLGYNNIHSASTGKEGVAAFQKLTDNGILPIVLLDYTLPDTNANEVIVQLFTLRPDVKVVIETAENKEENVIKEAIRRGIYLYLQKPIRFDNIKDIMRIIEDEDAVLTNGPASADRNIDSFLVPHTVISLARLSEYTGQAQENLSGYLQNLASKGRVSPLSPLKEIACSVCNSVSIEQDYRCPSCNSNDFTQGKLIEHFKCGNVSSEKTYEDNICPKCKKELKIIGVDYKTIDNFYTCKSCNNKFPEPYTRYLCGKCNNTFRIEQAKWVSSMAYRVIN